VEPATRSGRVMRGSQFRRQSRPRGTPRLSVAADASRG